MVKLLEERMRSAIAAADFDTAHFIVPDYCQATIASLTSAATAEERRKLIVSFSDVLSLARVVRAHLAAQLASTTGQVRYQKIVPERHSFQIEA